MERLILFGIDFLATIGFFIIVIIGGVWILETIRNKKETKEEPKEEENLEYKLQKAIEEEDYLEALRLEELIKLKYKK